MTITITREMTITHDDFFRLLPRALRNRDYTNARDKIYINDAAGLIEITLAPETTRKIASLTLPVTDIKFVFNGFLPEQVETFMKSFDLSYQKGGG